MSEKRKLILDFALDCLFIVLFCLAMVVHSGFIFYFCFFVSAIYSNLKRFFQKKSKPKKRERELTTAEVIAVFAIAISGFYILIKAAKLIFSTSGIIPIGIIVLSIRVLYLSKELAALQTSKPASN